jgi:two-component system NtrC family sensor kinase
MKNDPARSPAPDVTDPFKAFFETLPSPAAVCDASLNVIAANESFSRLLGKELASRLQGAALPHDGEEKQLEIDCEQGRVALTLARRGETVSVLARAMQQVAPAPDRRRIEQALLELGRNVALAASEEELVAVVARGVKELFLGRPFCLFFVDPRTLALTSLYAEGAIRPGAGEQLVFKRSALEKTHLSLDGLPEGRVRVTDDEVPPLFKNSQKALCAPLVASGQLFGLIQIEYPQASGSLDADDRLLVQLANQVAVGVRNAKLIDELSFIRKYLEELLEHANALILVANRDRQVLVFNRQLAAITGYPKEEVLGHDLLRYIPENERLRLLRVISASLKGEKVSNFETRIETKAGGEARVAFSTSSVLNAQGEIDGVIAIGQNLTMVRELEKRVIQAEKLSQLGKLAASVAHEINNPMTAVQAYAGALLDKVRFAPGSEADQDKLKKIVSAADRILNFTRDLVSYARPAQDRAEPFDLNAAIEMAIGFCEHTLKQHGITAHRELGQLSLVPGVKGNLVQVFVNLITNACHAMKPGGSVTVSTAQEGPDVVVRIADTGSGIDPAHLDQIFEPFFTTKPEGKGNGLGLSIVQGIVEKHGGTIGVQSTLGAGTTFVIRLPLAATSAPTLEPR